MQQHRMRSNVFGISAGSAAARVQHACIALCIAVAVVSCGRDSQPPAPAATPLPRVQQPHIAGLESYKLGVAALEAKDTEEALRLFQQATLQNRDLAEAWYQLGHLQVMLAPQRYKSEDSRALQMFRDGLQMEQEALRLLDEGKVSVWNDEEQTTARTVMDADLQGADEALSDPNALAEALRLRVH